MLFTPGRWRVRESREHDFIDAWRELGQWTAANIDGGTWAKLIQGRDDPRDFLRFGPWRDEEAISRWRADPGFQERVGRIQELLESSNPAFSTSSLQSGPRRQTPDSPSFHLGLHPRSRAFSPAAPPDGQGEHRAGQVCRR